MTAPLYGLVLAGGRSTRMGRDKAALVIGGRAQLARAFDLLAPLTVRCFVSVREDQRNEPLRATYPQVVDLAGLPAGPASGIIAAQRTEPGVAWLVVACDLPLLDAATLQYLIAHRDPARAATAYRSSHDGLPEPLCAIWEPATAGPLSAAVAAGQLCPRKFLLQSDTLLLDQPRPESLENVNTPAELAAVTGGAGRCPEAGERELKVQYFALLREQAGRREETVRTRAATPRELYEELQARHSFTLGPEHLKVAVNAEFADWSRQLAANDTVVFIPPVAGG